MATTTILRLVRPTTTTLRPYWDLTATLRDLVEKLVAVRSQYGRSLGVTGVLVLSAEIDHAEIDVDTRLAKAAAIYRRLNTVRRSSSFYLNIELTLYMSL